MALQALLRKTVLLQQREDGRSAENKQDADCRHDQVCVPDGKQVVENVGGQSRGDHAGVSENRVEHRVLSVHGEIDDEDIDKHSKASLTDKAANEKYRFLGLRKIGEMQHDPSERHEANPVNIQRCDLVKSDKKSDDDSRHHVRDICIQPVMTEDGNVHFIAERVDPAEAQVIDARQHKQ